MKSKEFTEQVEPLARELVKACLTATPEVYEDFKIYCFDRMNELPEFEQFYKGLIDCIDKGRARIDERVLRLFSIMDECDCDMDTAELLLQDEEEEAVK